MMNKQHRSQCIPALVLLSSLLVICQPLRGDDAIRQALDAIRTVDVNGQGHAAAVPAMKVVNAASIEQVPAILLAMDGANPLASNWLRSAVVSIVQREGELPRAAIEEYFKVQTHSSLGRLLAFDLLTDGNGALKEKMVPGLIDDPSLPLRAKAIDAFIKQSEAAESPVPRIGLLAVALEKARDVEQLQRIAKLLNENGVEIDLAKQMGFLKTWHIVGTFDNKNQAGFDVPQGPENGLEKIDLNVTYEGASDPSAKWSLQNTTSATGVVDLNQIIGKEKGVSAFAYTTVDSAEEQAVEIRIGTPNATKVWVNGKLAMANEIYHNSNSIDKFVGNSNLKKGKNEILIKVCQNEQTDSWAQDWEFQLRLCDDSGKAIGR